MTIKVFLVDDQVIVAEAIRRMLADEKDIELVSTTDPRSALKKADELGPTVVLQDLVMPDVDGLTLVRYFRAHPRLKSVPIIVLSSKEDPRDKSLAFSTGASDYLVKIPDRIELLARIRSHARSYIAQRERDEAYAALEKLRAELEAKNAELLALSTLDGLTGIANRRRFDDGLRNEWARCQRDRAELSLILIDIDFFKLYNDRYGHLAGDDCLRRVAGALARAARRPADLVARYGGEEFVIMLPGTDLEGAKRVAELAKAAVAEAAIPHEASTVHAQVTISQGIASMTPGPDRTPAGLVETADKALYETKRGGRNGFSS